MSMQLPNGSTVHIGELDVEKEFTKITNAAEAVVTANAHGLKENDYVMLTSGWGALNGRVFKVSGVSGGNDFKLTGIDTTDTNIFPAGAGVGKVQKVKTWTQIDQILEVATQGGDQNYYNYGFLEDDFERQLPTTRSAMSISFTVGDDPERPGYKAAVAASNAGKESPLRIVLKNGEILYCGYMSVNETPTLTRNEGMAIKMDFAISGKPNRYSEKH